MAANIYDDTLEQVAPDQGPKPTNPYDQTLDAMDAGQQQKLRTATVQAGETTPDRAADVLKLSTQTGQPAAVVERNYDVFKKKAALDAVPYEQIQTQTPALAKWATDEPAHAAVAADDMDKLGALEWLLTAPQRALAQGINSTRYAMLRSESLIRPLTQEEHDQLGSYKQGAEDGGQLGAGASWFRGAVTGLMKNVPMLFGASLMANKYGMAGAAEVGAAGALGGSVLPGAGTAAGFLSGAATGYTAGAFYGSYKFGAQLAAGQAYDEYLGFKDEHGQPLDPTVAKAAALATGAINGALMVGGFHKILEGIPGVERLGGYLTQDAVKTALLQPTVRAALLDAVKTFGGTLTYETANMVAQRAIQIMGGELAKASGAAGKIPGQLEPGNVDLYKQPKVTNPDGSVSTVDSLSVGIDGREVLLPTVTPDGRHLAGPEQAIAEYQKTGRHLGVFDTPENATAFAQQVHEDYAAGRYDSGSKFRGGSDILRDLVHTAGGAVQDFALLTAAGPMAGFAMDVRRAKTAAEGVDFYKALGEGVAQSKTVERLPDAAQKFVEQATKDGPIATLYAPVESWSTYWQGKGVDPAKMAEELTGNPDAYDQAVRSGEDLQIPTARYAVKLAATEHNAFFANELRLGPDEMNGRESAAFDDIVKQMAPEDGKAPAAGVRDDVQAKLTAAGFPAETAQHYAQLWESAFGAMAERAGVDPVELYRSYGLDITRPDLVDPAAVAAAGGVQEGLRDEQGRMLGGEAAPAEERRKVAGEAPGGVERRNPDAPINVMADIPAAAARMRAENPAIDRQAKEMQRRAQATPRIAEDDAAVRAVEDARQPREGGVDYDARVQAATASEAGDGLSNRPGEQSRADEAGRDQNGRDANGAADSRVSSAPRGIPGLDEVFERRPLEENKARLEAPRVREALQWILDEMREFPYEPDTWVWAEPGQPKFREQDAPAGSHVAAGGNAMVREGGGGAAVYRDILGYSPVNTKTVKGEKLPAKKARGDRNTVINAIATALEDGDIHNNLAEGAVRVAENRAAGIWRDLERPQLPAPWATVAPVEFTDALSDAVDKALEPHADLLGDETAISDADLTTEGDTSFNVEEFSQSLFDDLEPQDPKVDTLTDTGEQQARLPGDVGDVREQNVQTPEFDAPFSLTSEIAKPKAGKQTTMFQPGYHGSPHKFEEFSLHAIGSGEGAQAYGWGLYFASKREIADRYREQLAGKEKGKHLAFKSPDDSNVADGDVFDKDGLIYNANPLQRQGLLELFSRVKFMPTGPEGIAKLHDELTRTIANYDQAIAEGKTLSMGKTDPELLEADRYRRQEAQLALEVLNEFGDKLEIRPPEKPGRTYTVDLPHDDDFLFYDKPASQQSEKVQAALRKLGVEWEPLRIPTPAQAMRTFNSLRIQQDAAADIGTRQVLKEGLHYAQTENIPAWEQWYAAHQGLMRDKVVDPTGERIYEQVKTRAIEEENRRRGEGGGAQGMLSYSEGAKRASEALAAEGIAGIRYLDGFSRDAGEGSSNYVVFDPKLAPIVEYDQPANKALTSEHVEAWAKEVQERAGRDLQGFSVRLTKAGDLFLESLIVDRGAQRAGLGSKAMLELTRFADLNGKRVTLTPAQPGDIGPGEPTSTGRLVKFYKRFGFVENKGRHRDLSISEGMYREPTAVPGATAPHVTETPAFRQWFGTSAVVDGEGKPLVVYHGAHRLDRFGPVLKKERATSGPMPFFTANKEIASKYATGKADTSLEPSESYDDWFRMKVGRGKAVNLDRAWFSLSPEERAKIAELAPRVQTDPEGSGEIQLGPPENKTGTGGYDQHIKEARGNHLKALVEEWLSSGNLFDDERSFEKVLKLAGVDTNKVEFHDPHKDAGGVAPVYLAIQHPLETGNITPEEVAALEAAASKTRRKPTDYGADLWDKNLRDAREWVQTLKDDIAAGKADSSHAWSSIPDFVTATLKGLGYDGIHDTGGKTGGEQHDVWIPFEPEQVKSAIGNAGTFDPTSPNMLKQERRGSIRFGADRQFTIALLERADLSTFLHESGHFFLEVFGDLADKLQAAPLEQLTDQQRHMLSDYGQLLQAFGVDRRDQIGVKEHEAFAAGFEKYLMDGKAPSIELQGAFSRFRAWLVGVYHSLKNLNVNLTAPVRGVLDRLLATDQAIAEAEAQRGVAPMFLTAEAAGMNEAEFSLYKRTIADASRTAREQLDAKLLGDVQREQTRAWKERRAEIRDRVAGEVYQRPEYRAIAAITKGEHPNGDPLVEGMEPQPMKLDRAAVNDLFGSDRAKRLPRGVFAADGGMRPETVARLLGFSSADELLTAIEKAPPMKDVIESATSREMMAEQGNLLLDGGVHQAAQAAVANEDRELVIRAELKALGKLRRTVAPFVKAEQQNSKQALREAGRERDYERRWMDAERKLEVARAKGEKQEEIDALTSEVQNLRAKARGGAVTIRAALPNPATVRAAADARIAAMPIRQINAQAFWSTSRRAGQQALERAARQDFDGAIQAKQQELVNLAMYRKAEQALEDVDARVRYAKDLGKPATRQRIGKAGESYLDQVDGILDRYEFAKVSDKVLERRSSIRDFVAGLEAQNIPVNLPEEVLDDSRRVNYKELTVEKLQGVTDGLKTLMHLVGLKNKLLKAQDAREFGAVRDAVQGSIEASAAPRPTQLEILPKDRKARIVGEWIASHTKLAEMIHTLDGHVDGGPVWDAIMRPINEAATAQETMHVAASKKLQELLTTAYTGRELAHIHDQTFIPAINASLSKEARLAVALNWGNEGNRQRLMESQRNWNAQQVQAILDTLDKRDLKFVQDNLDYINSFWPQIAAKQERVLGIAPEKIEGSSWTHATEGEQRGGYYPIAYDGRLSVRQGTIIDDSQANVQKFAGYTYATTKRGYTVERQARVNAPVRLELSVMYEHLEQVFHDLTHHEMLIDVGRLMADRKVQQAIQTRAGDQIYKQMRGAIMDIALGTRHATTALDRAVNYVRNGATIAGIGWNVTTALHHLSGVFNGAATVGPEWVARGMVHVFRDAASMESSARWVSAKSEMMRLRNSTADRDVADLRSSLQKAGGWFDNLLRTVTADKLRQEDITASYMALIGSSIKLTSLPIWIGAYEKQLALERGNEPRAIAMADQAVLDSLGGGQIKDLAQVQRGSATAKLFTTFYTYGSLVFNQTKRAVGRTDFKSAGSVGQMVTNLALLYLAPAAFSAGIAKAFGKAGNDESWPALMGKEMLAQAMNTMVLLRELGGAAGMVYSKQFGLPGGTHGYEGPTGLRIINQVGNLATQVQQGEADRGLLRAVEDTGGVIFHLPLGQIQRSIDGFAALEDGTTTNPGAVLVGPPPKP